MFNTPLSLSAPAKNLRRLIAVRSLLVLLLIISSLFAFNHSLPLPYKTLATIMTGMVVINAVTWFRLTKPWPVTDGEFFSQIFIDIISISFLLFFSGGASNPFVSYYLVPLSISAATLAWAYTWCIALASLAAYTLLLFYHFPIPEFSPSHNHHNMSADSSHLNLHIIGMWINFLVSAGLITYFVVKMAATLRQQESQLMALREDDLRDEQLMAVATLAAGTAHELGTPLSTIKVLLSEMQKDYKEDNELSNDLTLIQTQITQCSNTLKTLVHQAELNQEGGSSNVMEPVADYCCHIIDRWLLMRPEVEAQIEIDDTCDDICAIFHPTIAHSIINLLNNAADANPQDITVNISWDKTLLMMDIIDHGPGVPVELANQLGKPFITTKGKGLGLGLFLTHATLSRYQGKIKLYNRDSGGTLTELRLPLKTAPDN